jgi:hypothetical protein
MSTHTRDEMLPLATLTTDAKARVRSDLRV